MQFTIILLITFITASSSKIQLEEKSEMSHKLVKRHCSCQPSACTCASIYLTLQISCSCPQTCKCPTYPPVTYTVPTTTLPPVTYTLPPVTYTLPPVTYTLPPITPVPVVSTKSSYCCILFICASCNYGRTYSEPSSQYSPASPSQYYLPPSSNYHYPPQPYPVPVDRTPYSYPTTTSTCSIGFTICLGGNFCCRN
ncbi:hypothetical protein QQG55_21250 [Brugia pahangi]